MAPLRQLAIPISIVIAGALVGAGLYFGGQRRNAPSLGSATPATRQRIRGIQAKEHVLGNPKAAVVIVEFSDAECPYCKSFHQTLHTLMREYGASGRVAWVYRHFPVEELHPKAPKEAEALECAAELGGNDGFWKYVDALYDLARSDNSLDIGVYNVPIVVPRAPSGEPYYSQRVPRRASDAGQLSDLALRLGLDVGAFEDCVGSGRQTQVVQADVSEAVAEGADGTPYSVVLVGDRQVPVSGNHSYVAIKRLVDALLGVGSE